MQAALEALTAELKRQRLGGTRGVYVSIASMQWLQSQVDAAPPTQKRAEMVTETVAQPAAVAAPQTAPQPIAAKPVSIEPIKLPEGDKAAQHAWLVQHIQKTAASAGAQQTAVGSGNLNAQVFFCGDMPAAEELENGEVFTAPAGQLLEKMVGAMGLGRNNVYLSNVLSYRPSVAGGMQSGGRANAFSSRAPTAQELAAALPALQAQLAIVQPKVLVALGKTAVDALLGADKQRKMGSVRGTWATFAGVNVLCTYHPNYLLRNNTRAAKRMVWEDFLAVMAKLNMPISQKQQGYFA